MGFLPLLLNVHLYICDTCILWNSCCYCQLNTFGDVDKVDNVMYRSSVAF